MLVVYSIIIVNMICNHILTIITKHNMLEEPTIIPPIAIFTLIRYPFRKQKDRTFNTNWVIDNLKIDREEYNYLVKKATYDELDIIFHEPTSYREKRRIIEIKFKYLTMYRYDRFKL